MNPYSPTYMNPVDMAIAWAVTAVWMLAVTAALRRRVTAPQARSERIFSAAALAFLSFALLITGVFASGLVFLAGLKIQSFLWAFWELPFLLSVVCVFQVLPVLTLGLLGWGLMGKWSARYSQRHFSLVLLCLPAWLVNAGLYFWLCWAVS